MAELNQYAISKTLGSTLKPIKRLQFGVFGLLEATAESLRARRVDVRSGNPFGFTYEHDRVVAQAFENVRDGASPDAILWDRALATVFENRCQELGLDAPGAILNRRLLNIRKNKGRYAQHGIVLSPTTKSEPHVSILSQYAHAIEFALVSLRYRHGASIDDILLDPQLSQQYEDIAQSIAPGLSSMDLRLGALYIRKSRFIKKKERESIKSLDLELFEEALSEPVMLSKVHPEALPTTPGLLELKERDRYLYISRNESLRPAVEQLLTGNALRSMGNSFWIPDFETITLQFVSGTSIQGIGSQKWEHRLIHDREPVFNWPIQKAA